MITVYYGHRVTRNGSAATFGPDPGNVLAAAAFEKFVGSLGVENALSIDDLDGPACAGNRFLLTFDDGYADNVSELLPILERMSLPAMIFVTTGFLDDRMLPYGSRLALFLERHGEISLPDGRSRHASNGDEKAALYDEIKRRIKPMTHSNRERFLASLVAQDGATAATTIPSTRVMLTRQEIRELDRHPLIRIGAHSRTHSQLNAIPRYTAYRDMAAGKRDLERLLGRTVTDFAYPYGAHGRAVRWLARLCGFKRAFTTEPRAIEDLGRESAMKLPRVDLVKAARIGSIHRTRFVQRP